VLYFPFSESTRSRDDLWDAQESLQKLTYTQLKKVLRTMLLQYLETNQIYWNFFGYIQEKV